MKEYGRKESCKNRLLLYGLISENMKANNKIFKDMDKEDTNGAPQMAIKL